MKKSTIVVSSLMLAALAVMVHGAAFADSAVTVTAAPVPDKGDTTWMIVATLLVTLMTIPGLALFYGGLVRSKNMLSVLMQVFIVFSLCIVLWVLYGYSLAFTEGNAFFGGFSKILLQGVTVDSVAATFSKGVVIPELVCLFPSNLCCHNACLDFRRLC